MRTRFILAAALAGAPLACTRGVDKAPPVETSHRTMAPAAAPTAGDCTHRGSGKDYAVGPGQPFATPGDVPFEALKAGDTVRIFFRPEPYRDKIMISGIGTEAQPIRVCGVPGPKGELPIIDGENAVTRKEADFPYDGHQPRGLLTIGHAHADQVYAHQPAYVEIENLQIQHGSTPFTFKDKAGAVTPYSRIVAGIFVERASHLTIRGCVVTQNNNGIFMGTGGDPILTHDVLLERNYIHDNGSLEGHYEHNVYIEGSNVTYQFNRFGPPRGGSQGILGANIKERSAGVVIRYNWIEDGAHLIDLVDAQESRATLVPMPSFHATYVYGNALIRGDKPSGSMIHYGGDSGEFGNYRKGTLLFYDNTVVVENASYPDWARTALFELSTGEERLDARNNVFASTVPPTEKRPIGFLGARDGFTKGRAILSNNFVGVGFTPFEVTPGGKTKLEGEVVGLETSARGMSPGFRDMAARSFALAAAPSGWTPAPLQLVPDRVPDRQYVPHQHDKARPATPVVPGALVATP